MRERALKLLVWLQCQLAPKSEPEPAKPPEPVKPALVVMPCDPNTIDYHVQHVAEYVRQATAGGSVPGADDWVTLHTIAWCVVLADMHDVKTRGHRHLSIDDGESLTIVIASDKRLQ